MAVNPTPTTVQQNLPSPYIEGALTALSERLLPLLSTSAAIATSTYAPKVAGISQFTQAAQQKAAEQAGLGSLSFDPTTGAVTSIGAGTGISGYEPFLQQAQQYSGPQAYQQFMSPYQQQVIDTTLSEFDRQRQIAQQQIGARAIQSGAFGGAREGVQQAEFGAQSLQDRAALQAQLLQQGFGQAQQAAAQAFQQQQGLASLQPQLLGQQIGAMTALGQQQQQQQQAVLDAQAAAAKEAAFEPYTRYGLVGQQLTGLAGGFPGQVQTYNPVQPASPMQTLFGTLAGVGGLAGKVLGKGGIFG